MKYTCKDLFYYCIAHYKQKRSATAQSFWALAVEKLIKDLYKGSETELKQIINDLEKENIISRQRKEVFNDLRKKRNEIIHDGFLSETEFEEYRKKLGRALFAEVDYSQIEDKVDIEMQTDLALKFGDRRSYTKSEVRFLHELKAEDYKHDTDFEKRIWNLKYELDNHFENNKAKFQCIRTGLVSNFSVTSEWIWIPVGFNVSENKRVGNAIISILIFRNMKARIYLDFGTNAIEPRLKYYKHLLNNEKFINEMKQLLKIYPDLEFWNVEHYSIITGRIKVADFINGNQRGKIESLIEQESHSIEGQKSVRKNILLFGVEMDGFVGTMHELVDRASFAIEKMIGFLEYF